MNFVAPYLDITPRKKFERYIALPSLSWGDTYPKFTNFAIIGTSQERHPYTIKLLLTNPHK